MFVARLIASGMVVAAVISSGISVAGARVLSAGDCGCFAQSGERSGQVATLTSATGRVVVSGTTAPRIAAPGQKLSVGERVAVGAKGSANVSLGSCNLAVQSGQELVIQRVEGGICAAVPAVAGIGATGSIPTVPLVIGGGALLAGGIALAVSSGDDSPASP